MLTSLRNQLVFLKQFGQQFETTGSLIPSSRFLAKAITRFLANRTRHPVRVLECGPGTGAFTSQIVQHLQAGDVFDLVELNASFVDVLRHRFETEDTWNAVRDLSTIHEVPFQDFDGGGEYDFVISGLPLNNFPPKLVAEIMETCFRLLKPRGVLSYFEYMYIRPFRRRISGGDTGRRIREVHQIVESYIGRHGIARDSVFMNTPPAWVQHLQSGLRGE